MLTRNGFGICLFADTYAAKFTRLSNEARALDRAVWCLVAGPDVMARASGRSSLSFGAAVTVENHPGEGSTAAAGLGRESPATVTRCS